MTQNIQTILISHAHKDAKYAEQLVKMIKATRVESKEVKIICSSYPGHDIPADVNIYDYLSTELKGNVWVIYLLSSNYYQSAACLNEMGATWVQNKKYSTFITPNFKFTEIKGAVDPAKNSFELNVKTKLNDFKNLLLSEFGLQLSDNVWESIRDTSLTEIEKLAKKELESSPSEKIEFESVRNAGNGKIVVVLRAINKNPFSLDLTFINLTLADSQGRRFTIDDEISDTRIHSSENKLIFRTYSLEGTEYSASRHSISTIEDFRFDKAYY
ncbi:hypothetical protein COL22_02060 [Bacillus thuringiensis]|uniref:toll/interleukin-1 receptor domain-containing protein n=1 Tax=Bacillus thuringiensis TaxID=1428 RepID=UPI000BF3A890|nr:toll/interleukin-1 receptor domain-containing protein [Bacillus thuringiensis]PFW16446.1 hypothetical protein COL22_02060 [Bacillus thuringiensis]